MQNIWNDWLTSKAQSLTNIRIKRAKSSYNPRLFIFNKDKYLNFISNDYLGIANHPKLLAALNKSAVIYGIGSTGAPTLSGYSKVHDKLSKKIASWLNYDKCLFFNSGYQLNSTIFSSLIDNNTIIWFDKNSHASHIDGINLSKAKFNTFTNLTIDDIFIKIENLPDVKHIILTEGSFSMNGTCLYLEKLINFRSLKSNVILIIDDAHGIGALGQNGLGTLNQLDLNYKYVDLLIGTMGKAFATHGGFVCGNNLIIDYLAQTVRGAIFSTNIPPCIAASSLASLKIIKSSLSIKLRNKLKDNIKYFIKLCEKYELPLYNKNINISAIQLLIFKDESDINHIFSKLYSSKILVGRICYPTVKKSSPRIRISLSAAHTKTDIKLLCKALKKIICKIVKDI